MSIEQLAATLVVLLLLAFIAEPVSRLLRLPYSSVLVIMGFLTSELAVRSGIDTGLRADNFHDLIFYVFIPVLVFESAYSINKKLLQQHLVPVLFLAVVGLLLTATLTAVGLYYGIAHAAGFPWIAALLTGAIVAATDPVAVMAQLTDKNVPGSLSVLLEGESLFNDAAAIVLFSLFLSMALSLESEMTASAAVLEFVKIFLGGVAVGVAAGVMAGIATRLTSSAVSTGMITLVTAYGSYLLAESWFEVSGVMSTLVAAIIISVMQEKRHDTDAVMKNKFLWDITAHLSSSVVFIIMGVTITLSMFEQRWLAMLIAIAVVIAARAVSVYASLSLLGWAKQCALDLRSQTVVVWGGLRGAVTLALALSLPVSLDYWWTIQSIAFGVVMFALFIQAPTTGLLLSKLDIRDHS